MNCSDWLTIVAVVGSLFTVLGVITGLFLYLANKIDSLRKDIHDEMKDFHGRLCGIEERFRAPKTHP